MHSGEKRKGALLMIFVALCLSGMQLLVRLTAARIPVMQQLFIRNLCGAALSGVILAGQRVRRPLGSRADQPALVCRSVFGFLASLSLFYASAHAAQADVSILNKMNPFLVTLLAVVLLKEKIRPVQWLVLLLAFGGALLVLNPSFSSDPLPLLLAFASALASAVSYTLLRYFKGKVDGFVVILYYSLFGTVFSLPFMLADFVVPTSFEWLMLLLLGLLGAVEQVALTYAYRCAPASEISIYSYTGIVFSMLFGFFFLGEPVMPSSAIGGALVVAASLIAYFLGKHEEKRS